MCKKTLIHRLVFSFGFFAFFSCIFFSSSAFANSVVCTGNLVVQNQYVDFSSCDTSSLSGSNPSTTPRFYHVLFNVPSNPDATHLSAYLTRLHNAQLDAYSAVLFSDLAPWRYRTVMNYGFYVVDGPQYAVDDNYFSAIKFSGAVSFPSGSTYTITISDDFFAGGSSSTPTGNLDISSNGVYDISSYAQVTVNVASDPCPELTYSDQLDNITVGIYVVAGVLIVLYIFYCIYRIIIRNSGVK